MQKKWSERISINGKTHCIHGLKNLILLGWQMLPEIYSWYSYRNVSFAWIALTSKMFKEVDVNHSYHNLLVEVFQSVSTAFGCSHYTHPTNNSNSSYETRILMSKERIFRKSEYGSRKIGQGKKKIYYKLFRYSYHMYLQALAHPVAIKTNNVEGSS